MSHTEYRHHRFKRKKQTYSDGLLAYSMLSRWQITYEIDPGIEYAGGPLLYDGGELCLFTRDGSIVAIQHKISLDEAATPEDAIAASRIRVDIVLLALRYLQLQPIHWWVDALRLEPPESGLRLRVRASGVVGPRPVRTPRDGAGDTRQAQLASWIAFASEAQETASPATAIRLYFLIIEDLPKQDWQTGPSSEETTSSLKAIRDFVSHREITVPKTRERLAQCFAAAGIETSDCRYDPSNASHQRFLQEWRSVARTLVDEELHNRLGVS